MIAPPVWLEAQLDQARKTAAEHFRQARCAEPLELYLNLFDEYRGIVEEVFEQTADLTKLREKASVLLADRRTREIFRYLSGPPVSLDDLKVLIQAKSLTANTFGSDADLANRLVSFVRNWHDRRRFPWMEKRRRPEKHEKDAAVLATAVLLAVRRTETLRRTQGSQLQEQLVAARLRQSGIEQVPARKVLTLSQAPRPGRFCGESMLGTRKADFIIGLGDGRTMAVECKVSNSATNSIKRLNNDAAAKASAWQREFGTTQIVTAAVLDGVYALRNLVDAQGKGLTIFWVHDLCAMLEWINKTRSDSHHARGKG